MEVVAVVKLRHTLNVEQEVVCTQKLAETLHLLLRHCAAVRRHNQVAEAGTVGVHNVVVHAVRADSEVNNGKGCSEEAGLNAEQALRGRGIDAGVE